METYNIPFCIDELSNSKDSAVGQDDIHYRMLKDLLSETLNTLFEYFEWHMDYGKLSF